jgi:hypothetical protein
MLINEVLIIFRPFICDSFIINHLIIRMDYLTHNATAQSRVGKGISAQASHRTVREALTSYGSCHTIKLI